MAVVDASVVVELLARGRGYEVARGRLSEDGQGLWAPHVLDAEVGHALRRGVRLGRFDPDDAGAALWEVNSLPLHRVEHDVLLLFAWSLRDNVSFYDALYVALAEMLDEPLITFDARLARAGVRAEVEVLTAS